MITSTILKDLSCLFDKQIRTLVELNVSADKIIGPIESLMEKKDLVVSTGNEIMLSGKFTGDLIFSPVIPLDIIELPIQAYFLSFRGNQGHTYFRSEDILDLIKTPSEPYYIFNLDEACFDGNRDIDMDQSFLTLAEAISLCLFNQTLLRCCVRALSSKLTRLEGSPVVHIYQLEHPKIDWDYSQDECSKWANPHCSKKKV
ncbi:hypothetical protein CVU82_02555 [Candidatus Falkowbacteria bacterium HGW-Falkowbacteria-1]|jgi:hypothetical protein|uniref:Uncharacterized protein n=1 Tax=Candidatus Falkowbacteria bacterium HGW-Falkowbacteria-1 TaxID=2013768 RepID=A0A2N2E9M6_9BACT|nr:MAG: hypothetical protein CVU82_02555 [Candidatus Falkowbacteria bacterium HGW-Falkowbacteria-1]